MTAVPTILAGTFAADPSHSSLQFKVRHMVVANYRASFEHVEATLVADGNGVRLEGSTPVASLSIRTPGQFRDTIVDGAEFFDAANHPTIAFQSDTIDLRDDGTVDVAGRLTFRGVTAAVSATGLYERPVLDPFDNVRAAIELRAVIDRRDWGMTWQQPLPSGGDALSWNVELSVCLALIQRP